MKFLKISQRPNVEESAWRVIHEAMPLPRADNYPEDFEGSSMKYKLDTAIPDEIEDAEGKLDYLDRGSYGLVYTPQSDDKKVVKYTFDRSEIQAARKVWEYQKHWGTLPQHIAGLYDFGQVPNSDEVYRLVLEKVNPLSEFEQQVTSGLFNIVHDYLASDDPSTDDYLKEEIEDVLNENVWDVGGLREKTDEDIVKRKAFVREYFNMVDWLVSEGFTADDAHNRNVGRRSNGDLVMLDYGMLAP
jgi:hypothetical protein